MARVRDISGNGGPDHMGGVDGIIVGSPSGDKDQTAGLFNVIAYGAAADGVTDDTTAIQTAINAACAYGNGIVFFPMGIYKTGPLTIGASGSYNTCFLIGESVATSWTTYGYQKGVILSFTNGHTESMFTVPPGDASDVGPAAPLFQDLWLRGNRANQSGTGSYGVKFTAHTATSNKARSGFFKRVRISEFRGGGVSIGQLRNAGIMDQVVILDVGASGGGTGSCLSLGSCQDWRFINCDFGASEASVIQDSGSQTAFYFGCNFFSGGLHGYKMDTASGEKYFMGCSFDRNQRNGVYIGTTSPDPVVFTNCRFQINSQETNNTYFNVQVVNNPNLSFIGCNFPTPGASVTKFPAYHFDLSGATTKGINLFACEFESDSAVGGLSADNTNFNVYGLASYNSFRVTYNALDVNHLNVEGGNSGAGVKLVAAGPDSNITIDVKPKGTSSFRVYTAGGADLQFVVAATASATSWIQASGSTADTPAISAQGTGSNVDLRLTPKGTGLVRFGTWTSNGDAAINGYVSIKDSGGTTRKLATIA